MPYSNGHISKKKISSVSDYLQGLVFLSTYCIRILRHPSYMIGMSVKRTPDYHADNPVNRVKSFPFEHQLLYSWLEGVVCTKLVSHMF